MTAPAPTVVRFCKPFRLYTGGETAGFPAAEAQWLIDNGLAAAVGVDDVDGDTGPARSETGDAGAGSDAGDAAPAIEAVAKPVRGRTKPAA